KHRLIPGHTFLKDRAIQTEPIDVLVAAHDSLHLGPIEVAVDEPRNGVAVVGIVVHSRAPSATDSVGESYGCSGNSKSADRSQNRTTSSRHASETPITARYIRAISG